MHLQNISLFILVSYCSIGFAQDDFDKFKNAQEAALQTFSEVQNQYMESITLEYESDLREQRRLFELFKTEVEQKWDSFKSSSATTFVDYDKGLKSRSSIDFEKGEVVIEVIVEDQPEKTLSQKRKSGELGLEEKLKKLLTQDAGDNRTLLKDQVRTTTGENVTQNNVKLFASSSIGAQRISQTKFRAKDGKPRVKYTATIKMVPDHIEVRAKRFKADILKQSKRFNIDPAVAFAIMQTESYFNPKARSHIPAYGLMQLVPSSGARDAYNFVYKRDRLLNGDYLYNPARNIELGCAYISKLRHVYFKDIKNEQNAYYCTISAYNTGPGNVARALTGNTKLAPAAKVANSMTPDQLYRILKSDLPHSETKDYLEKVTSRLGNYQSWSN